MQPNTDKNSSCSRPAIPVSAAPTENGEFEIKVTLSGVWTIRDGLSDDGTLRRTFDSFTPGTRASVLTFDCSQLSDYDSSLVCYVVRCASFCTKHGIRFARETLPEDVEKLFELTLANRRTTEIPRMRDTSLLAVIGRWGERTFSHTERALKFLGETTFAVKNLFCGKAKFRWRDCLYFIQDCGINALPIITLISFITGMILAYIGAMQLRQFGAIIYVASLIALAMVREMGVIMTSVIMCGRTGSAFAAQIGSMQASEEISALRVLAVNPVEYLVLPRIIALTLMMPLLTLYSDFIGILGGLFVMGSMDITVEQYWRQIAVTLNMNHVLSGVIKSIFFGFMVAWAGCYRGMVAGKSSLAVGDAATSAAVLGMVLIVIGDGIFAVLFNAIGF